MLPLLAIMPRQSVHPEATTAQGLPAVEVDVLRWVANDDRYPGISYDAKPSRDVEQGLRSKTAELRRSKSRQPN